VKEVFMISNLRHLVRSRVFALCLLFVLPFSLVSSQTDTTTGTTDTTTVQTSDDNRDGSSWGWLGLLGLLGLAGLRRQKPTVSTYRDDTNRATR
jgi:MYXO-CTERM domain-containing protein